jgi:hypothetical protein
MLRSKSLSIKAAFFVLVAGLLGFGGLAVPSVGHAQSAGASTCSTINGTVVCTDGSGGGTGNVCVTSGSSTACLNTANGSTSSQGSTSLGTGLGSTGQATTNGASSGWLSRLTWWLSYAVQVLFDAVVAFFKDLVTYTVGVVLALVLAAVNAIGVPSWISQYSLGNLLGQSGSVAAFFMSEFQIPLGLSLLGLGYVFRLTRKFLTLFQW